MIIICYHIKDFESYTKTQTPRSVGPIAINVQHISSFVSMELWMEGKDENKHITKLEMNNGSVLYTVSYTHLRAPRDVEESRMPSSA